MKASTRPMTKAFTTTVGWTCTMPKMADESSHAATTPYRTRVDSSSTPRKITSSKSGAITTTVTIAHAPRP